MLMIILARLQPLFIGANLQRTLPSSYILQNSVRFNSSSSAQQATTEIQKSLQSFDQVAEQAVDVTSQAVGEASLQFGYLQSIGLAKSWWWPPELIQHVLEIVHVSTGLPWWATITITTIGIRALLFPLYVKSSDTMARNSKIKPQLDAIQEEMYTATDMAENQKVMLKRKKLLADNGVKTRYLLAPVLQLPLALGFFSGLRGMANANVDGFSTQGALWFQDLTAADPYLALQCLSAAVIMGFMKLGGETGAQQFSPQMQKIMLVLPLVSIPATMSLSSGVVLYFFVNGLFSVLQTTLLRNKAFRHKMGIADIVKPPPADPNAPQKGIADAFKEHFDKAKKKAEKKAEQQEQEQVAKKLAEARRKNGEIKIVRRPKN
ncbi:Mitochondrial inner membrane protein OXA1 [Wickerhamomyces ciferrii]|uniref:Mitochondrial inner membrane protein OXA1 n=1 Tax=Wickerhamomyces ciferrii (strain ATCC 14091 / BCRC 22168 / CBS 111 / JCM 3599 / NBRC 0793 / NRRL Y-1031 F-60-10) TaxID=1206466 RepID=K0KHA2_WICCF|nr:Mitochondrial inner membrane protein OXA1 [Wickerhamomyces ciferrii]CCH41557.1 Mitochondrial inner membrane protein OXA1 [Wickerhamomyces ciferrii]